MCLLVGPEGGWTGGERSAAVAQGWAPVTLGPQILRAETAALAALAVIVSAWIYPTASTAALTGAEPTGIVVNKGAPRVGCG